MESYSFSPGSPLSLGATIMADGVNFAVFSRHAEEVALLLFRSGEGAKIAEINLDPDECRTGDLWHILVHGLDPNIRYGFRVAGPYDPNGRGHFFASEHLLLDPYAKALTGSSQWNKSYIRRGAKSQENQFHRRCCIVDDHFDWGKDRPLNIPLKDSIIYELHVRGYTRHASSGVEHPGTYAGIVEKIPYLKELGVTAVELLPVTEFNENEIVNINPENGKKLLNFWGYSPLAFFAPKASYAVNGRDGNQVREFKEMVKALHQAGIEVILDIVFNHTAEGGSDGPVISFRGLDNTIYYLLDSVSRDYLNFSGCGNTLNCNHPLVRSLIMDCLRYWVVEMHVDGFRFDLASILGRAPDGKVLSNPPMVEQIAEDPVLAHTKIIAEAWDAAGLYQVGSFSSHRRWAEWNGKFRDDVRSFMAGHQDTIAKLATRMSGSADLYQRHELRPFNSINFITSHDGFTLYDLVSYNHKHNLANGEKNCDGDNVNLSWNSGVEGDTDDQQIMAVRWRRIRTLAVILFLSQGTPMLVAGDELGRSQKGNNNAYCQDNEISWLDWRLVEKNGDLLRFFRLLISLRKNHPVFRRADFFPNHDDVARQEVRWQSLIAGEQDWSAECKTLAFFLDGGAMAETPDDDFFVLLNGELKPRLFEVPKPVSGKKWYRIIDTWIAAPLDIVPDHEAQPVSKSEVSVGAMSVVVLLSR
ncbi:MAG: glycogen debranching protein GlgX [Proteobacteria bacterium]|nr:glycogen debranching protein GlgX [Pseudomonadota bacterium]MBU1716581.1 glycogen debranching protein GlgX [Pseudomonadota bacterium]